MRVLRALYHRKKVNKKCVMRLIIRRIVTNKLMQSYQRFLGKDKLSALLHRVDFFLTNAVRVELGTSSLRILKMN